MLVVESITKSFGSTIAVNHLSFSLRSGRITGLLGPNGAGKTTTIRILLGLIPPDEGKVYLSEETKTLLGYLPEEKGLYKNATACENILYLASLKGIPKLVAKERIKEYLKVFNVEDFTAKKVSALSKGYQQITQIIAALIHNPDVIIFDEPYSGLDPIMQGVLSSLLQKLRDEGKSIMLSTHLIEKAELICDDIILMHSGKLLLQGEVKGLLEIQQPVLLLYKIAGESKIIRDSFKNIEALNDFLALHQDISVSAIDINEDSFKDYLMQMLDAAEKDGSA